MLASLVDILWELQRVDEAALMLAQQLELQAGSQETSPLELGQGHAALAGLLWERSDLAGARHHFGRAV